MPDYEKMYKQMVNAAEDALKILIEAQKNCEEYMSVRRKAGSSLYTRKMKGPHSKN